MANNNQFPSREQVARIRTQYPKGTRIEITHIADPYSKLTAGSRGTVEFVDDTGSLFCAFDNGEHIGLLYGVDGYRIIPAMSDAVREQILTLRTLPQCPNMLSINEVLQFAIQHDFYYLVDYIHADPIAYAHFVLTGKRCQSDENRS